MENKCRGLWISVCQDGPSTDFIASLLEEESQREKNTRWIHIYDDLGDSLVKGVFVLL